MGFVTRPENADGITRHRGRRRDLGQRTPIGPLEPERPVGRARDVIALFMNRTMMAATEQDEVRECGRAALGPVAHVMSLRDPHVAARKAAARVSMLQRPA